MRKAEPFILSIESMSFARDTKLNGCTRNSKVR